MDRNDAPSSIDDQAVQWFVLLRDDDATQDDHAAFAEWRAADPSHETAWRSVERMWSGLDAIGTHRPPRRPLRRRANTLKAAATAAVLLVAVGIGWQMTPVGLFADYRTAVGERRTVALQDGSQVELGAATAIDVSFNESERRIKLLSGEAFFTVTKDPARPFIVGAGSGEVKVLGTAFDVKVADDVMVAVTEHTVQVSTAISPPVKVTAGQEVRYGVRGISAVTAADLDAVQAWRQDQIVFRDVPLNAVLEELGRYRRGSVVLLGGALGKRHVTAVFDTHNADAALDTIAQSLSLRIYRATNLLTILIPDNDQQKNPATD
jgi:transmembrane sensor